MSSSKRPSQETNKTEAETDTRQPLTQRQKEVLDVIEECIKKDGYPPTVRELGKRLGIRSTNGVNDHVQALSKKGYLEKQNLKSRALRPVLGNKSTEEQPLSGTIEVPVLGKIAAGLPALAQEQYDDRLRVDRLLLGNYREVFALRVKGESMIEAGILDGDFVFVRQQPTAHAGDIVVALIGDEATVKYYQPESDQIVFRPANKTMSPIAIRRDEFRPVHLLGTVIGLYRRI
ncbi:MAG TPA: transcriptional repressor LexA [Pseudomonadota bacterium]|nr:transcriptional repressor LexA [Pseudomonadota bacterium]